MILKPEQKTGDMLRRLRQISDESFRGVEAPPPAIFESHFEQDDVFIHGDIPLISGFAIVTDRRGPFLWSIAVGPEYRCGGIGSRLLHKIGVFYREKKADGISLTCRVDNPAQKLYFDNGYRVEGVIPNYYGRDIHGLSMRRTF